VGSLLVPYHGVRHWYYGSALFPVLLVFLDLFGAFETADHNVVFFRLKHIFGLSGKVLEWLRSNLEQCSQRVSVHGILSEVQPLLSDEPEG